MARSFKEDHTNIYREKITRKGTHQRDGYGYRKGEAYEEVTFNGPYLQNRSYNSQWRGSEETMIVEMQKLEAGCEHTGNGTTLPVLQWVTIKTKVIEDDES